MQLTLLGNDCDRELHLRDTCRLVGLDLDAIVVSFLACGQPDAVALSERAHNCAGASGRAGAAARIIMLGCISGVCWNQIIREEKSNSVADSWYVDGGEPGKQKI